MTLVKSITRPCSIKRLIVDEQGNTVKEFEDFCGKEAKYIVKFRKSISWLGLSVYREYACPKHAEEYKSYLDFHSLEPIDEKLKIMI